MLFAGGQRRAGRTLVGAELCAPVGRCGNVPGAGSAEERDANDSGDDHTEDGANGNQTEARGDGWWPGEQQAAGNRVWRPCELCGIGAMGRRRRAPG
jgi:hypothetical protein